MKLRGKVALRGDGEAFCPLCRVRLGLPRGEVDCGSCGTRMHLDCAEELGGCPTLGCERQGEVPGAASAGATPVPWAVPGEGPRTELGEASPIAKDGAVDQAMAGLLRAGRTANEQDLEALRERMARLHEQLWDSPSRLSEIVVGNEGSGNSAACGVLGLLLLVAGAALTLVDPTYATYAFSAGAVSLLLAGLLSWAQPRQPHP